MIELYILLTAVVILAAMFSSYNRTGDPLTPLVIFSPMLMYVYVVHPYMIYESGGLLANPIIQDSLDFPLLVSLLSVLGFCLGASHYGRPAGADLRFQLVDQAAGPRQRQRFLNLATILGTVSFVAMIWLIQNSGGLFSMLSKAKPFFTSGSGYIGELPMLTYPAVLLLAAAWQGKPMTIPRLLYVLYIASPQIAWAIIGKRRGTIFLIAVTLAAFWYLVRNKRPSWRLVLTGVGMVGLVLLFVTANRMNLAYTKGVDIDFARLGETLSGETADTGDEFVVAAATIISSNDHGAHYWGSRFFAMFFVRPIPSFLWESKWDDLGFSWMVNSPGKNGLTSSQWIQSVGFEPAGGNAPGFVADLFLEFSWGGIVACYAVGYLFSWLWRQWVKHGGLWAVVYIEAMILSIYLPSQSFGAWSYRFAMLVVPTIIVFKILKSRSRRARPVSPSQMQSIPSPSFDA